MSAISVGLAEVLGAIGIAQAMATLLTSVSEVAEVITMAFLLSLGLHLMALKSL